MLNGITIAANSLWIVTKLVLPDVIIKNAPSQGTAKVFESTFHKLAHASHFKQVGSSYWIKYINYIITYGPYGNGHGINNGIVAVGEMWGYHMGYFFTLQHFGDENPIIHPVAMENFTPFSRPSNRDIKKRRCNPQLDINCNGNIIEMDGWIPVGIIHNLMDRSADIVRQGFTDNVSDYTLSQIFNALQSDVQSLQAFRNRLLSNNGNRQQAQVKKLFEAYYYN